MTPAQFVTLVDAAMRIRKPVTYLESLTVSFARLGRSGDCEMLRILTTLFDLGEIETVLGLRAEWKGSRNP